MSIVQEAGLAPRPVWTSSENLAFTGIRSPDRLARSQSPYGLHHSAERRRVMGKRNNVDSGDDKDGKEESYGEEKQC